MKNFSNNGNIYQMLEKQFLTEEEYNQLIEYSEVDYEDCGMSGLHYGYYWVVVTYNDNPYDIYVEGGK